MAAQPDGELFSEDDDTVQERVERAVRAEAVSLVRATNGAGLPTIILMLGLIEGDAMYALSLKDARWLSDELDLAVMAMKEQS